MKIIKILLLLPLLILILSYLIVSVNAQGSTFASDQNLDISPDAYTYWGPISVQSGNTIQVDWAADREITVAILNEIDWSTFQQNGLLSVYNQVWRYGQSGSMQFTVNYSDTFYLVVQGPFYSYARLYSITGKIVPQGSTFESPDSGALVIIVITMLVVLVAIILGFAYFAMRRKKGNLEARSSALGLVDWC